MPDSGAEQGPTSAQLLNQVSFLEAEVADLRRRLADAPGSARALDQRLLDTQRSLAAVTSQNERLAETLREARDQIVTPQGGGRPARAAADRLRHLPQAQRGRLRRRVHRRSQAAGQRQPVGRPRHPDQGPGGHAQRGPQRRRRPRLRGGRRGRHVQGAARRRRPRPGDRQRRRGARRAPRRAAARAHPARRRLAAARRQVRLRLREGAEVRGRGARPRGGARHRLHARSAASPARSSRSATRSSCPTSTPTCSRTTSSSRRRACCSTARPAAARP